MTNSQQILAGHLVLDFGGWRAALTGKILSELGAEVVMVEDRRDPDARRHPPYAPDSVGPDVTSASFMAYQAGKRSVALDFGSQASHKIISALICRASFIIESVPRRMLAPLGLSAAQVQESNPGAILVSVTAFGRQCEEELFERADSLAVAASSGFLYTTGTPDRPPVMVSGDQPFLHASSYAATAALLAHRARRRSGVGGHIDASAQEAMALTLGPVMPAWQVDERISKRVGNSLPGRDHPRSAHRTLDGWVTFSAVLGRPDRVISWMEERGEPGTDELREMIGEGLDIQRDSDEKLKAIEDRFESFLAKITRAEAWEAALSRRFMMFPVNTIEDMIRSPIHEDRQFFSDTTLTDERPVQYPTRLLPHVQSRTDQRVEHVGESTIEILRRIGLTEIEVEALWRDGTI